MAKKSKGFEMKLLYDDIKRNKGVEKETGSTYVDKGTLSKESDFMSIHVPLLPTTKHMIREKIQAYEKDRCLNKHLKRVCNQ